MGKEKGELSLIISEVVALNTKAAKLGAKGLGLMQKTSGLKQVITPDVTIIDDEDCFEVDGISQKTLFHLEKMEIGLSLLKEEMKYLEGLSNKCIRLFLGPINETCFQQVGYLRSKIAWFITIVEKFTMTGLDLKALLAEDWKTLKTDARVIDAALKHIKPFSELKMSAIQIESRMLDFFGPKSLAATEYRAAVEYGKDSVVLFDFLGKPGASV
ncbi:hypothetical protein PUMCH_003607 [Australozyma saopauloensis]|uniref:Uncharacterized protein n=1 Tax=Australozyma saopauloensis TaxID=291208 RepID=A0AAX4HCE2_9ASCO|nr:hypothetical protein PUMCH_003607 [[Candida] saopauloensis]